MTLRDDLHSLLALWPHVKARGTGRRGRPTRAVVAVNAYERKLSSLYADWARDVAKALNAHPDDDPIFAALLNELEQDLIALGRELLPEAYELGLASESAFAEAAQALADALAANQEYIQDTFIPVVGEKVRTSLADDDIAAVLGSDAGEQAILGALMTLDARLRMGSGRFWSLYNEVTGQRGDLLGKRIYWKRDPMAEHCQSCLDFGEREYESYASLLLATGGVTPSNGTICGGKCRCSLQLID